MTSSFIGLSLAGKQPPTIEEVYPKLFEAEQTIGISKEERFKQELMAYADLFNAKRHKEQGEIDKC